MTVLSTCSAWAVGTFVAGTVNQTLTEHWNGSVWKIVPSPDKGGSAAQNQLAGIAAISGTSVWAVGSFTNPANILQTLILHWNGRKWTHVASPNPGGSAHPNLLTGVAATKAGGMWASGFYFNGTADRTLILHWNGRAWRQVRSADAGGPAASNVLTAVSAVPAGGTWAVGRYVSGTTDKTLAMRWNGHAWKLAGTPNAGGSFNTLASVAATSATNAWAVGSFVKGTTTQTLIEHWTGHTWAIVKSADPGGTTHGNDLLSVTATSASLAFAVGQFSLGTVNQTLIELWNGKAWKLVPSPDVGGSATSNGLAGVAASSTGNAWAVGSFGSPVHQALALRWS